MSENGAPPGPSADGNEPTKEQQELAEKLERVKAAGWNNTIAIANETVGSGAVPEDPGLDDAPWLCNAVVYQWDDDYGEIGPENPKLEEELFYGQHLMKAGNRIKALDFDVQTFGPVDVKPIRSVGQDVAVLSCPTLA
jgi:ATP-dependent RNA helicase DDX3X